MSQTNTGAVWLSICCATIPTIVNHTQLICNILPRGQPYPQHTLTHTNTHTHTHTLSFGVPLYPSHRLPRIGMTLSTYQAKVTEHLFQIVAYCCSLKLIRPPFKCYSYQTHITNAGQSSHNTLSPSPPSLDILIFDQTSPLDYCNEVWCIEPWLLPWRQQSPLTCH